MSPIIVRLASSIHLHILRRLHQFKICLSVLQPVLSFLSYVVVSSFFWVYLIVCLFYAGPNDAPLAPTPFEAFVKVPSFLRPHNQIYCTRYYFILNVSLSRVEDILYLSYNFHLFTVLFASSVSLYIFGDFFDSY
jgi:hypothetical protein